MSTQTIQNTDTKSEEILDAAWERLSHYGLNKTTMAEIADDCQMSAANLYRYFKNKNDIAAACCTRAMDEVFTELRKIVRANNIEATEKLRNYAVRVVEMNVERAAGKSKMGELVANMTENNTDIVHKKIDGHHALISEILAQGSANGEFEIGNVLTTAQTVHASLAVFDVPLFADLLPIAEYRKLASNLVDLLVEGIGKD